MKIKPYKHQKNKKLAVKSDNEVFIPSLSSILLAVCNNLKHTVYCVCLKPQLTVLPFHGPIHLEWKKEKRKKNGPKVEEDSISRQIFSATTGGEGRGGGCTARAGYMWARRRSCIFQPFFTPIKVPSLVFYTGSFYGRIEQQMHIGTKWENNSRITMILYSNGL